MKVFIVRGSYIEYSYEGPIFGVFSERSVADRFANTDDTFVVEEWNIDEVKDGLATIDDLLKTGRKTYKIEMDRDTGEIVDVETSYFLSDYEWSGTGIRGNHIYLYKTAVVASNMQEASKLANEKRIRYLEKKTLGYHEK